MVTTLCTQLTTLQKPTDLPVTPHDDLPHPVPGSLSKADQKRFPFDSATMDWRYYLQDVHCPAVTAGLRALSSTRVKPQVRIREREQLVLDLLALGWRNGGGGTAANNGIEGGYARRAGSRLRWARLDRATRVVVRW